MALVIEPDEGFLFLHHKGHALSPHQLSDRVRHFLERAGIKKPGACHLFRHTMATLMLENGADISTTQIYTQVSIKKLKDVYEHTHPTGLPEALSRADREPRAEDLYEPLEAEAED